jgi:hypothetical protein
VTKLCIYCEHFNVVLAREEEPDWSEVTLGRPAEPQTISCRLGHWEIDNFEDHAGDYRKKIETGLTCADFKLIEDTQ